MNFIFTLTFLVSLELILLIFFSKIAFNINLVDSPSERKIHLGHVPLVGGIVIYSSYIFLFLLIDTSYQHKIIIFSSLIIFFVGLYDDKFDLGVSERIFFQIISCLIVVGFGINTPDKAKSVCNYADGVVIGSSIVSEIDKKIDKKFHINNILKVVRNFSESIKTSRK